MDATSGMKIVRGLSPELASALLARLDGPVSRKTRDRTCEIRRAFADYRICLNKLDELTACESFFKDVEADYEESRAPLGQEIVATLRELFEAVEVLAEDLIPSCDSARLGREIQFTGAALGVVVPSRYTDEADN